MWKAAVLALTLAACAARSETLDGKVVEDHSANPLASVELRVAKDGVRQLVADLETDTGGRFHADGVPAGEYRVEVSKASFAPLTLRIRVGPETKSMLVRLVRLGAISGRVADAAGAVVPGATVLVFSKEPDGSLRRFGSAVTPGQDGRYRVFNLPPGEYAIAAAYGKWAAAGSIPGEGKGQEGSGALFYPDNEHPRLFHVAGGEDYRDTDFLIVATSLSNVSGAVRPAGMRYVVALTPAGRPEIPVATQRLDSDDGVFHFEGIPPGTYDLYASGPVNGYGATEAMLGPGPVYGRARVTVGGQAAEGLTIPVEKGRSAAFILRGATPKTPAGCPASATLTLTPLEASGVMFRLSTQVNFAKPAMLEGIAPRRYRVQLGGLGEKCYSPGQTVDLTGSADELTGITVTEAASVRGRLTGAPNPADFVIVLAASEPREDYQSVQAARADAAGRFSFTGLPPGLYRIAAAPAADTSPGRWVADWDRMIAVDLAGGVPVEVDLPVSEPKGTPQ